MRALLVGVVVAGCRIGFGDHELPLDDAQLEAPADAKRTLPSSDAGMCVEATCAAGGGACIDGVCELVATSESPLACPPGMPCRLICNGYRFCRDGASCVGTPWCEVACVGYRACRTGVTCGSAECLVTCNGEEACRDGIFVDTSGVCTSHCCGLDACAAGVSTCTNDATCD